MKSVITKLSSPFAKKIYWALLIAAVLGTGYKLYDIHRETVQNAVISATNELLLEQQILMEERERALRAQSQADLAEANRQLRAQKARYNELREQLLISDELNSMLQSNPDAIIDQINQANKIYFQELERVVQ